MEKERKEQPRELGLLSVILFFVLLAIGIVFYITLYSIVDIKLSPGLGDGTFGFGEIVFSLMFAFLLTAFMVWCKSIMRHNPFLGASIGVLGIIALGYGFNLKFFGVMSTIFMISTGVVVFGYLGFYFFRFKGREKEIPGEFD